MIRKAMFVALAGFMATGCDDEPVTECDSATEDCDSGTDWYTGPWEISAISYSCTPTSNDIADKTGTWTYHVETDGLAGLVTIDVTEGQASNNPWEESHDLDNTDYDDVNGAWDVWDLTLSQVAVSTDAVSGTSSFFGCAFDNGTTLSFKVTMDDESGAETDCAIWGYKSDAEFSGDGCFCFDTDGDCTN